MYVDQSALERAVARVVDNFPFSGYFDPSLNGQITVAQTVARYLPPGSRILDFGAGPVDKTAILAAVGYDCTAVDDLSDEWHQHGRARELILKFAEKMNVEYVVPSGNDFGLSGEFDMVMLHHVLEHLHDSPRYLLIELLEHVRTGGYLFITVPNHVNLRKRVAVLAGKTSLPSYQSYYWNPGRGRWRGHVREYTKGDCLALAQALELEVVEIQGAHNMLEKVPPSLRRLYLSLSKLVPSTRDTWSMVARKPANWAPKRELEESELEEITGIKFWSDLAN